MKLHQNKMILEPEEIALLGASLRAIEPKILKPCEKADTVRIWLQGGEPYFDIFLELRNDEIIWFQFTLRGKSLSWERKNADFQTGMTNELMIDDVSFYAASKIINNDDIYDRTFVNLVKSILETRADEEIFAKALKLFSFTE